MAARDVIHFPLWAQLASFSSISSDSLSVCHAGRAHSPCIHLDRQQACGVGIHSIHCSSTFASVRRKKRWANGKHHSVCGSGKLYELALSSTPPKRSAHSAT